MAVNDGGDWRVRNSQELEVLINGEDIMRFISISEVDM